jgi:hypothetical protein
LVRRPQGRDEQDSDQEYRAIEATLLASTRGRWFLAEHGRRARRLDDAVLQDALNRLRSSLHEPTALLGQLSHEVEAISTVVQEVEAALKSRPARPSGHGGEPSLTQQILSSVEQVHELAWTLQAREGDDFNQETCERIARQAAAVYALSARQAKETEYTLGLLDKLDAANRRLSALGETIAQEKRVATEQAAHAAALVAPAVAPAAPPRDDTPAG